MMEVKGNGNIVSRELSVSTFVRLHLGFHQGLIELHPGVEEKVVVEADENLQDYFAATNAGRTLYVTNETKLKQLVFTKCVVRIYIRQLEMLYLHNVGNVTCPEVINLTQPVEIKIQSVGNTQLALAVPSIKISCQAVGTVTLNGSCEKLDIQNRNQGDFDASQLKAGEITINNKAVGNVRLHADTSMKIAHYGVGYIHYTGNAVVKDVKQYGVGEVKRMTE